jgi:acyl carrier protein
MVFEKIAEIIAEHLGLAADSISRDSSLEDLGIDSLDTVEMVMQLEGELGVELELEGKIGTVGELVDFVESKM